MRSLLLGAVLAAVVLFLFGFVVWGLMPVDPFSTVSDEPALSQTLVQVLPASGVYLLPDEGDTEEEFAAATEAMRRGPLAMVFFRREGVEPMAPAVFALGFLHMFVTALLLGLVLRQAAPALPSYGARVAFVALLGLTAAVWARLGEPIWWHFPWGFHLLYFFSDLLSWTLAGLVLARFVRRREPTRLVAA
ncbi:MAG TPA: hypothetical protein VD962_12570 [Rubricoccaceae bacterium]|nr:hypothetical protein [Rubricoccaceae bacterium]